MPTPSSPQRATWQRAAVLDALEARQGFTSAQDIHAALRDSEQPVGLATVYRHLREFAASGLLDTIQAPDGESLYRLCGTAGDVTHHHHLVCRNCGRTVEVEGRAVERWSNEVARRNGYTDVDHTVEIFGLCPACSR